MTMPTRIYGFGPSRHNSVRFASAGFAALLALTALVMRPAQEAALGKAAPSPFSTTWVPVSGNLLKQLTDEGKKIRYPGRHSRHQYGSFDR